MRSDMNDQAVRREKLDVWRGSGKRIFWTGSRRTGFRQQLSSRNGNDAAGNAACRKSVYRNTIRGNTDVRNATDGRTGDG
jgi:hypothetical protein